MAEDKIVTAPIAIIKVDGKAIGKIRDIRATENIARGEVRGIGDFLTQETPALSYSGTFSCDFFLISLTKSTIPGLIARKAGSKEQFVNTTLLGEVGVDIYLYKKLPGAVDATTGLVTSIEETPIAILRRCFIDSNSFNISEGQISTTSQTGRFLDPIVEPV